MDDGLLYRLRVFILESYIRITMIGYESKQKKFAENYTPRSNKWTNRSIDIEQPDRLPEHMGWKR